MVYGVSFGRNHTVISYYYCHCYIISDLHTKNSAGHSLNCISPIPSPEGGPELQALGRLPDAFHGHQLGHTPFEHVRVALVEERTDVVQEKPAHLIVPAQLVEVCFCSLAQRCERIATLLHLSDKTARKQAGGVRYIIIYVCSIQYSVYSIQYSIQYTYTINWHYCWAHRCNTKRKRDDKKTG